MIIYRPTWYNYIVYPYIKSILIVKNYIVYKYENKFFQKLVNLLLSTNCVL